MHILANYFCAFDRCVKRIMITCYLLQFQKHSLFARAHCPCRVPITSVSELNSN